MTPKAEILEKLQRIAAELEELADECKVTLKGYADGAVEVANLAVCHAIDVANMSEPARHTKG
jgi:hypothetical protein